eukprot:1089293-Pelagomonas_calceolata.AAC.1
MGIRRVTSSSPCLILVMRIERSLLKSASGARKFISYASGSHLKRCIKKGPTSASAPELTLVGRPTSYLRWM